MIKVKLSPKDQHFEDNVQQLHTSNLINHIVVVIDGQGIMCLDVRVMASGLFAYTPIRGEVRIEISRVTNVTFYLEV